MFEADSQNSAPSAARGFQDLTSRATGALHIVSEDTARRHGIVQPTRTVPDDNPSPKGAILQGQEPDACNDSTQYKPNYEDALWWHLCLRPSFG